ncbi:MAG: hypothetical protein R3344_15100, partial [Acidobacteriota bacterium]|nr:hypothetical protein [Acidobacteriota bacterium]
VELGLEGSGTTVREGIASFDDGTGAMFAVSSEGTLVYVPTGALVGGSEIVWLGGGRESETTLRDGTYFSPRLSPDGRRLAVERAAEGGHDIWIHDLVRDTATPLTTNGDSHRPVWSADGRWVAFDSTAPAPAARRVYRRRIDFAGEAELLFESSEGLNLDDWSPDGRWLVGSVATVDGGRDVWAFPLDGNEEPRAIIRSPSIDSTASISPDGKFVLYHSDESGPFEVYVTSFPDAGRRVQISTAGGSDGAWSPGGDRIVYPRFGVFYEVDVTTEPELSAGTPREIHRAPYVDGLGRDFDLHPDGKRLIVALGRGANQRAMVVVVNWLEELKRLVPTDG